MKAIEPHIGLYLSSNIKEDSMMYVSIDEYLLTMEVIDEFLSTPEAIRSPEIAASNLGGDNIMSSFVTSIPEVMNSTAVQTNEIGPSKINPIEDNCYFATEQMSIWSNIADYSIINDYQHPTSILLSTGEPQSPSKISHRSPSLPVTDHMEEDHTEESTSCQNMDSIPPQFQSSQLEQQRYADSIMPPDIDNITLFQQWPSKPSNISNELPDGALSNADLMTSLPGSLSVVQTNSVRTPACNNQQSQNTANSSKLVSETSLVPGFQVASIQIINSLGQKNTNLVEKPIKCDVTEDSKTFVRQQVLEERKILVSADKLFECNICHRKFTQKPNLYRHRFTHTGKKLFECNVCHKKFTQKRTLDRHYATHPGKKSFECDVCCKKFGLKEQLSVHCFTHTGHKPFECNLCGKKFTQKGHLNQHYFTHTGQKPFECDVCCKRYRRKSTLKVHYFTHTGYKSFECDVCGKKYRRKSTLKVHCFTHTGYKPFECNLCGKKYTRKINLNKHYCTHTGQKPFECDLCCKKFRQKSKLKVHCLIHTVIKPYECNLCGKKYRDKRDLNKHHCNVQCIREEPFKLN